MNDNNDPTRPIKLSPEFALAYFAAVAAIACVDATGKAGMLTDETLDRLVNTLISARDNAELEKLHERLFAELMKLVLAATPASAG
jgi:hypothetical protein